MQKLAGNAEFHAYFYRKEVRQEEKDIPMRPAALTNMPLIDEGLGKIAVQFWDLTWNDEHRYLPYEMRLLLSLTNAVVWEEGSESSYRFRLFGMIPFGTHTIQIIRFSPDRISSREGNEHVPVWNHDITLVSLDDSRTQYMRITVLARK